MPTPVSIATSAARWRTVDPVQPATSDGGSRPASTAHGVTRPSSYLVGSSHAGRRGSGGALVDLLAASRLQQGTLIGENDMQAVLDRVEQLRQVPEVRVEELGRVNGTPIQALHFGCTDPSRAPKLRLLVTGGVHGNEPVGPGAAMLLCDQLLAHPELRECVEVTVVPVVNPVGFQLDNRRNGYQKDLNRHCRDGDGVPAEIKALRPLLRDGGYGMVLDLHSAGSAGNTWFALRMGGRNIVHEAMRRFGQAYDLLQASTPHYTMEAPGAGYSDNPATVKGYAADHGADTAVTLEAPRATPYRERVQGMAKLVRELVACALEQGGAGIG